MMVFFGKREMFGFFESRYDWAVVVSLHSFDDNLGGQRLLLGRWHDAASILSANIVALAVELGRVVHSEEDFQYGFEWNQIGVEYDFNDLCMTGRTGAYRLISWIWVVPTCIGRKGGFYTVQSFERTFSAPKTTSS